MEQSQKNNKDFFYVISLLLVAIVLISLGLVFWGKNNIFEKKQSKVINGKILSDQEIVQLVDGPYEQIDEDRLVFNVSQNTDGPKITKVIIAPQKVSRGEEQYLEVWVNDEQGVKSVQTETELDGGFIKKLDMELFEGDTKNGKWRVTWVVHDTHDETYNTKFMTTSIDGRHSTITYAWLDPCSPPKIGDWTTSLSGEYCDNGGIIGGNDNIIIPSSSNFVLTNSTTLVFPPYRSITLGDEATISLCEGCTIEKAYMVIRDPDADGQFAQGASQNLITATTTNLEVRNVNGVSKQGKWINGVWYTYALNFQNITNPSIPMGGDCYEADTDGGRRTYSANPYWYNDTDRGDRSWDYNCSGAIEYRVGLAVVGQCQNTPSGFNMEKRLADTEYYLWCGTVFCGFRYNGGSSWSCSYGDSEPRNNSACDEIFGSCTPSTRAADRH